MSSDSYEEQLEKLQVELVTSQIRSLETGAKILIVFEGRDTAGKDGVIRRITEHLSVRATRVVALPKPSERERSQWYFQRYVEHLPAAGEWVILNRSWYNRAGVERVMGFATEAEQEQFLRDAPVFERMLVDAGITLVKYWLDISKPEQAKRLDSRRTDPLKRLKVSPLDAVAQEKWDAYSDARDEMLTRTHTDHGPWWCVRADHKHPARLNVIGHLLHTIAEPGHAPDAPQPEPAVLFPFEPAATSPERSPRAPAPPAC